MATVRYRIRGKNNPASILARFKNGDQFDFETNTGLKVDVHHWSSSKQKVKNIAIATYKDEVNNKLNELRAFILAEYFKELSFGYEVNLKWLKSVVSTFFERPDSIDKEKDFYLDSFVENFIKEAKLKIDHKTGKLLSQRTIEYYELTLNKIRDYIKFNGKRIKLVDINLKFHESFVNYLSKEQLLNSNTIGFYMSKLILFCKSAERKGIKINLEFKNPEFYKPSNKTKDVYLNENEIADLFKLQLPFDSKLDNARDWFIIGLWSGLRVSDLLKLTKNDIEDSLINITNKKTGIPVIIPLHEQVKAVLDKRKGNFPRPISDQRFNDYIKDVCKLAKIDKIVEGAKMVGKEVNKKIIYRKTFGNYPKFELVSSHTCRRSFATNHYGKLDTLTIMKITGHKTEKQFLEYIKITPKEYAIKLKKFWKNQTK